MSAQPVDTLIAIKDAIFDNAINVIGIDEVQFFSSEIVPVICSLVDHGKRVIVAGLDLDFRGSRLVPCQFCWQLPTKLLSYALFAANAETMHTSLNDSLTEISKI